MKKSSVFSFALMSIALLLWVEQGLEVSYLLKTVTKVSLFLAIPFLLFRKKGFTFLRFPNADRKSLLISIGLGTSIMSLILFAFILLYSYIDIDSLLLQLDEIGVTSGLFPFIALYILFGNSLLEEFFFRGLLPDCISNFQYRLLIPSFLFAIYHVSIFLTWFSFPILVLAVFGLWLGGAIFQFINERSGTILPSWIIHMFADAGVLLIGVYIFYFH